MCDHWSEVPPSDPHDSFAGAIASMVLVMVRASCLQSVTYQHISEAREEFKKALAAWTNAPEGKINLAIAFEKAIHKLRVADEDRDDRDWLGDIESMLLQASARYHFAKIGSSDQAELMAQRKFRECLSLYEKARKEKRQEWGIDR